MCKSCGNAGFFPNPNAVEQFLSDKTKVSVVAGVARLRNLEQELPEFLRIRLQKMLHSVALFRAGHKMSLAVLQFSKPIPEFFINLGD